MPPKIMFRVFFRRKNYARNDNETGLQIVAPRLAQEPSSSSTQNDMALSMFFGSRLHHLQTPRRDLAAGRASPRPQLTLIKGTATDRDAMAGNAGDLAERRRCR